MLNRRSLQNDFRAFLLSLVRKPIASPKLKKIIRNIILITLFTLLTLPPAIQSQNINEGLISHWSFDNDVINAVIDETSNTLNGTAFNITYTKGPIGKAAVFNGINSRILLPDINSNPPDKICSLSVGSISLWFRFKNLGGDILPLLYFGESATGSTHNSLIIEIGHGQDPRNRKLYFTIVNQRFCYDSKQNLNEDTWYHFVAVVSSTGNTGYINGVELTNRKYNLGSNSSYTDFFANVPVKEMLSLGYGRFGQQDPFFPYKGSIDDVRIYDRPLSSSEVKELYDLAFITNIFDQFGDESNISLDQNSPNPFETETLLSWYSNEGGMTKVEIFDTFGQKVKTLVDNYNGPGHHKLIFKSGDLLSGIYYCKLQVGKCRTTKRLIIMK